MGVGARTLALPGPPGLGPDAGADPFFFPPLPPPPPHSQDTVNFPVHMKNFNMQQLKQLTKELRSEVVNVVSKTGGEEREKRAEEASERPRASRGGRGAPAARMRAAGGGVGGTHCAWFWCQGVQQ